jgi:dethiobiotin synthase
VLELSAALSTRGFDVAAVRPPTVPPGGSRLRLACHAYNTEGEVDELARFLLERRPRAAAGVRVEPAAPPGRALFVVGTDTGVGKTVVSAALLRAARARGRAAYWKPVQTGTEDDSAAVRALAGAAAHETLPCAWRFPLPASPHEAAADAHQAIEPERIAEGLRGLERTLRDTRIVVELAGGLLVPYRSEPELFTQADWLASARRELVLVARAGLGTLNHTLLTLEAAQRRHLSVAGVVVSETSAPCSLAEAANVDELRRRIDVPLLGVVSYRLDPFTEAPVELAGVDWWRLCHSSGQPV